MDIESSLSPGEPTHPGEQFLHDDAEHQGAFFIVQVRHTHNHTRYSTIARGKPSFQVNACALPPIGKVGRDKKEES